MTSPEDRPRICLAPGGIGGGGIGVVMLNLGEALRERGHPVDLLLLDEAETRAVPQGLRPVRLGRRARSALPALVRYLGEARPAVLISARDYVNLLMLAGLHRAGLRGRTRLVWTYHTHGSTQRIGVPSRMDRLAGHLADRLIRRPDARVAVSAGVAQDLEARLALPPGLVEVVDNPVWTPARLLRREDPCPHPWLAARAPGLRDSGAPVILGAGRLTAQKDFPTLLRAFARLREARPGARLVILGEGEDRPALAALGADLGLTEALDLPGHVPDALPYLARADLFALSSRWEGLPTVLIEAMGCGCAVVSTDCPSGPSEILDGGRLGPLVPPGDPARLAEAMLSALDAPGDLAARRDAALRYGSDRAARRYLEVAGLHE
ncbi:glycosyltransferase [Rubellimicrobium roseum]|uniref:Glycosyltransferase n=1 Tax=Rubellimicrobium roseum TaxID=687525 RepID=A0A5C4NG60_9RHOB|nr:glycosyltransferase [Rubellimicrobium roseum]TNC73804.1 glycosyltransferase [Rubellimicrobium roseum]